MGGEGDVKDLSCGRGEWKKRMGKGDYKEIGSEASISFADLGGAMEDIRVRTTVTFGIERV